MDTDTDLPIADPPQSPGVLPGHPADAFPSLGKPVSSTTHTCGRTARTARTARRARRARTSSTAQVEDVVNCCNC